MNYAIVFSSVTGNTAQLAERLAAVLPKESGAYFGAPSPEAAQADLILAGFWTDKGACSKGMAEFLESLHNKQVFLFGTAGFGGSEAYFAQILDRVRIHLDPSNQVIGAFMCQGKMPPSVRARYETLLEQQPQKMGELIQNYDRALSHPDEADLAELERRALPLKEIIREGMAMCSGIMF